MDRFDDLTRRESLRFLPIAIRMRERSLVFVQRNSATCQGMDILDTQNSTSPDLTVDGVTVNVHSLPEAVSSIVSAAEHGDNFSVCTLNLDHVEKLQHQPDFLAAYRRARFVTADGFPIVMLSRMLGTPIARTTGADLVEPVCREAAIRKLPIFLLGSNEATLATASQRLYESYEGLEIAGCLAPGWPAIVPIFIATSVVTIRVCSV